MNRSLNYDADGTCYVIFSSHDLCIAHFQFRRVIPNIVWICALKDRFKNLVYTSIDMTKYALIFFLLI